MKGRRLGTREQNEVYRYLALSILANAKEALAGACTERAAQVVGYESTTEEALDFFRTDWAERLIEMAAPGSEHPDDVILGILEGVFGERFEVVRMTAAPAKPFPRSLSTVELHFGDKDAVELELIH